MGKFLVAGITQRETIVKVNEIPVMYQPITNIYKSIYTSIGGDAFNEAVALKWLGNTVHFCSMIGVDESPKEIRTASREVHLNADLVLPLLEATPSSVVLHDNSGRQQSFEDIKDARDVTYDFDLFAAHLPAADMVVLANANFCRPLLLAAVAGRKKIALNIHNFKRETEHFNRIFLENSNIIYVGDDGLKEEPYEFLRSLVYTYHPEIIILGQGANGVIIYDYKNDSYTHYNTVKTNEIVNTIGAGNALFSCFLHFYNKTGDSTVSIKNALLFASYKIGFVGTSNGFMTERQIDDWNKLIWK